MTRSHSASRKSGFTLIELLVVIAIIGLLAALLFPAFKRAQENGYQASCASHMQQIYQAVQLYRQDEKVYPGSLAFLLPADFNLGAGTGNNTSGTGFFKGGRDGLLCADDDTDVTGARSSYGDISGAAVAANSPDMSVYMWNYWGYRATNATCTATDASGCAGTAYQADDAAYVAQFQVDSKYLTNPAAAFDATNNPVALSKLPRLSNRFAPTSTIITHCIYHRMPTASGKLTGPFDVTTANGSLARDVVLRLDGSARVLDISTFHTNGNWAKAAF